MEGVVTLDAYYKNKRVLVTGHTGFKGAWLCHWLLSMGCRVTGYSLPPDDKTDNLYTLLGLPGRMDSNYGDIRDLPAMQLIMAKSQAEIVFHLAAQSLVLPSYESPIDTFATNIMGTANLLECARLSGTVQSIINVTTDKCYENNESARPFREGDALGGHDPYSASKAAAEIVSSGYRHSFLAQERIHMATVRAGNVIGGGDFAKHRILPDIFRAARSGEPVTIRHPGSTRPWQHVLDVLRGYLMLAQVLGEKGEAFAGAFNFGPDESGVTVGALADQFIAALGNNVAVKKGTEPTPHEAKNLLLDTQKAKKELGWKPALGVKDAVAITAAWYREYLLFPAGIAAFTATQLEQYRKKTGA